MQVPLRGAPIENPVGRGGLAAPWLYRRNSSGYILSLIWFRVPMILP